MPWSTRFDDPVPGCTTLKDASDLILKLPKAQQQLPHWQAPVAALIMAAGGCGSPLSTPRDNRMILNYEH